MAHVMIVEDDEAYAYVIEKRVTNAGHDVTIFTDWVGALKAVESNATIDVLVTDLRLPPGTPNGVSVARMAMLRRPRLRVVYMTAYADIAVAVADELPGLLLKGADASNVLGAIETALTA